MSDSSYVPLPPLDTVSNITLSYLLFISQAVYDIFHVSLEQRADDIKQMLVRNNIYKKRSTNLELCARMPILTQISKRWARKVQQTNKLRVLLCRAFETTYTNTEIALEICRFTFRSEFFDEKKRTKISTIKVSAQVSRL